MEEKPVAKLLNIRSEVTEAKKQAVAVVNNEAADDSDYDLVRDTLKDLMADGQDLLKDAIFIAKEKQDAKTIEATAKLLDVITTAATQLSELNIKRDMIQREVAKEEESKNPTVQNNIIMAGTTNDLLSMFEQVTSGRNLKIVKNKNE